MSTLHNGLSVIHPDAKIGKNVIIDPFVTIAGDVEIGDNTWIGAHAVIMDGARIGENCKIHSGAVISGTPQDLKFQNEKTTLRIGNNVVVREFCTLNRGTEESGTTIIGDNCLLMAYVHIAHDCILDDGCIISNAVMMGGHVELGKKVVVGGTAAIHQFVKVGDHAMVGGGALARKDIPPFIKADRTPLTYTGVNSIGLKRRGFEAEKISHIQDIYRLLYKKGYNIRDGVEKIEATIDPSPERDMILAFIRESTRGIIKG